MAEHRRVGVVHGDEIALGIGQRDPVVRGLDCGDLPREIGLGRLLLGLGELARRDVADDRGKAAGGRAVVVLGPHREAELDREFVPGLAQGRHLDSLADQLDRALLPQPSYPGVMALAVHVRDDEIEALAQRLGGAPSEHCLGGAVPQDDAAHRIGADEGVGGGLGDQLGDAPFLPRGAAFEQGHHLTRHQLESLGLAG